MDVILSLTCLFFLLPVFLFIYLLVRWKLGSPALFKQIRPGYQGKLFYIVKFRTMSEAIDEAGNLLPDEDRLTALGRLLRATSLDELPELWNVLKGDMSFVGPRPLLPEYFSLYTEEQMRRHLVRPGITGWAQINGRNAISWEEKFNHDIWYVDNHSLFLDIKIIFLTVVKVLKREGIHAEGNVTMNKFEGTKTCKL